MLAGCNNSKLPPNNSSAKYSIDLSYGYIKFEAQPDNDFDSFFKDETSRFLKTEEEYSSLYDTVSGYIDSSECFHKYYKQLSDIDFETQNVICTTKVMTYMGVEYSVKNLTFESGSLNQVINCNISLPAVQRSSYYVLFVVVDTKNDIEIDTQYTSTESYDPTKYY